jgi:hypothetical protein
MTHRRWFIMGVATICVTSAISLGIEGFAAASAARTNNLGQAGEGSGHTLVPTTGGIASAAKTSFQYYSIAASGFAPDGIHSTTDDYFNEWDPTTLSNQDSGRCFNAAVHLPSGVKMVSVTFYFTEGATALFGEFNEQNLVGHTATELASFDSSTATSPTYSNDVIAIPKADQVVNTQNGYSLGVCPSGTTTFSGVTIAFTG